MSKNKPSKPQKIAKAIRKKNISHNSHCGIPMSVDVQNSFQNVKGLTDLKLKQNKQKTYKNITWLMCAMEVLTDLEILNL